MKYRMMIIPVTVLLVACSIRPTPPAQTTSSTATVPVVTRPASTVAPTAASNATEEAEVKDVVENFGKKLQAVSLLSPDAAQEIQKQYSDLISPALLKMWMSSASSAPGRMVSSPWPDHIEITTLEREGSDRYGMTGFVIEMTSVEVASGGAAARIPVRIVVQKDQGRWLITEYTEER